MNFIDALRNMRDGSKCTRPDTIMGQRGAYCEYDPHKDVVIFVDPEDDFSMRFVANMGDCLADDWMVV